MRQFYRSLLKDVLDRAVGEFCDNLRRSPEIRRLLDDQGVGAETLEAFRVGYATEDWSSLTATMKKGSESYFIDCCRTLGLVHEGKRGCFDVFRNRIMIPVLDDSGTAVGFTSRTVTSLRDDYCEKKFDKTLLNSTHSPIFDKRSFLVGFYQARGAIRDRRSAIVVRDPVDLLKLHSRDRPNAVMELLPGGLDRPPESGQPARLLDESVALTLLEDGDRSGRDAGI